MLVVVAVYWRVTKEAQLWFIRAVEQDSTYSGSITVVDRTIRGLHADRRESAKLQLLHGSYCKSLRR